MSHGDWFPLQIDDMGEALPQGYGIRFDEGSGQYWNAGHIVPYGVDAILDMDVVTYVGDDTLTHTTEANGVRFGRMQMPMPADADTGGVKEFQAVFIKISDGSPTMVNQPDVMLIGFCVEDVPKDGSYMDVFIDLAPNSDEVNKVEPNTKQSYNNALFFDALAKDGGSLNASGGLRYSGRTMSKMATLCVYFTAASAGTARLQSVSWQVPRVGQYYGALDTLSDVDLVVTDAGQKCVAVIPLDLAKSGVAICQDTDLHVNMDRDGFGDADTLNDDLLIERIEIGWIDATWLGGEGE